MRLSESGHFPLQLVRLARTLAVRQALGHLLAVRSDERWAVPATASFGLKHRGIDPYSACRTQEMALISLIIHVKTVVVTLYCCSCG